MIQHRQARAGSTPCQVTSLRCLGGPWHGQRRVIASNEPSLVVPGTAGFRYVRQTLTSGEPYLSWSNDEARW